jgi:hypothetical protein
MATMLPLCLSRITDPSHARHFGDGRHKFYLELRCPRPALPNQSICRKCVDIYPECKNQFCGLYPHGKVNEPIPNHSHLFGGSWYQEHCKEWGAPSDEMIQMAIQYQENARRDVIETKDSYPSTHQEMEQNKPKAPSKSAKPKVNKSKGMEQNVPEPIAVPLAAPLAVPLAIPLAAPLAVPKEAPKPRPKPKVKPKVETEVQPEPLHKEVVIPTHQEHTLEELDTQYFEVEYIQLSPFEWGQTTYFRDRKKNKLYKKIKDSIGSYVGRFDPDTETIFTDVPDSDEE